MINSTNPYQSNKKIQLPACFLIIKPLYCHHHRTRSQERWLQWIIVSYLQLNKQKKTKDDKEISIAASKHTNIIYKYVCDSGLYFSDLWNALIKSWRGNAV